MQNQQILAAYIAAKAAGKRTALATVVRVIGSAYRSPGAKLLIVEDGTSCGSISGGCLEKDVVLRTADVIAGGQSTLLQYSTTGSDDEIVFGVGAGCTGQVDILVEPDNTFASLDPLRFLDNSASKREVGVIATVFLVEQPGNVLIGDRVAVTAGGQISSTVGDTDLASLIAKSAFATLRGLRSTWARFHAGASTVEVFLEVVRPAVQFIVCGNGQEVRPLSAIAEQLEWDVQILEKPVAEKIKKLHCDDRTAVAILTHNYWLDLEFVRQFAQTTAGYIGLLGPKQRTNRITQELLSSGAPLSPAVTEKLHAPIGLDLGAETAAEIALSVVAEVQALMHDRSGDSLRDREGSIHGRTSTNQNPPIHFLGSTPNVVAATNAQCPV